MPKRLLPLLLIFLLFISCNPSRRTAVLPAGIDPWHYSSSKSVTCGIGAVVSAHPLASQVGLEILKQGGNAFDAAIATLLTLAVVYPGAGNIGGGGFMVARAANGEVIALDFREKAPALASRDMYISNGVAQTKLSKEGHLSAGVPGTVLGLFDTHAWARLPFSKLIQPAIELAEKGFAITEREAASLDSIQNSLKAYNTIMPVFYKPGGWSTGDTLVQKDLAMTLIRIRDNGADGFYKGETARLIVEEMKRGGGIISYEDLNGYKAKKRDAYRFRYKDVEVIGMPMPSSGGLLLHQMMKMIEKRNIASLGFHSPASIQLMAEIEKRVFADRGEYMGDADFYKVPVKEITSDEYLQNKMKDFMPGFGTPSIQIKPGKISQKESDHTTHISIIDKEGNAVALTTTLNNGYGSHTVVGGAGFFLNDEMDDFSIMPGVPNMYGAIGGEANAIVPGKRMLSSMTPTIVLKNNQPFIILGTPGGTTIPTSVFQTLVNIIEFNIPPEEAVNNIKFHHQWLPDSLYLEKGFPLEIKEALSKMGYMIRERTPIGRTELIMKMPDGTIKAVADKRGDDDARGY